MRRGEVWWAQRPEIGRRPFLILSRDLALEHRNSVTVAEITRTIRGIPTEVELDESDGMMTHCCVNLDNIITISKNALTDRVTSLSPERMLKVSDAVRFALDLPV